MKAAPTMLQSLPPPTTFSVPAQAPPPSLLQAQLSAASLAPLLQNPPQPLLPQPPPKGTVLVSGIYLAFPCKAVWTTSNDECYLCCCFGTTFEHRIVCVVRKWSCHCQKCFPGVSSSPQWEWWHSRSLSEELSLRLVSPLAAIEALSSSSGLKKNAGEMADHIITTSYTYSTSISSSCSLEVISH